jgi:1-acyl-sn-glycerol-3-phosphate acyltransferase
MGVHYQIGYNLSRFLARTLFDFRVLHPERMIEEGGAILAMNHQSYLDPPLAGIACRREIYFLARKSLLGWPIIGALLPKVNVIPVDQERADSAALKAVIKVVRDGHCTIIFPEGTRTHDGELGSAQPGLGFVVARTLAPVVPMRIFGAREAFPRGGRPRIFTPICVVIGEPVRFTTDDCERAGRDTYQQISDRVMERIAALRNEPDASSSVP